MATLAPAPVFLYRPSADDPTLSMIIDDGFRPLGPGFRLYTTPTGYLIRIWHEATFGRIVHDYRRWLWGEPCDLALLIWGLRSWDDVPADGSGYWGPGDAQVDDRASRCLEAAGLLVPYRP